MASSPSFPSLSQSSLASTPIQTTTVVSQASQAERDSKKKRAREHFNNISSKFQGFKVYNVDSQASAQRQPKRRRLDMPEPTSLSSQIKPKPTLTQSTPYQGTDLGDKQYRVEPSRDWEIAYPYRRCTIPDNIDISPNDTVFVKPERKEDIAPNAPIQGWVAWILEIRGGNGEHIYVRVYWMYRPEDLPGGRQPYHGWNELVASNDMAIISAATIDGKADVKHWVEKPDEDQRLRLDELYWRQTLDVSGGNILSELPKYCSDRQPYNPDEVLIKCESCGEWLHKSCVERDAVRTAYETHGIPYPKHAEVFGLYTTPSAVQITQSKRRRSSGVISTNVILKGSGKKNHIRVEDYKPSFSAKVTVTRNRRLRLLVTDRRPESSKHSKQGTLTQKKKPKLAWEVPARCLTCGELIDDMKQAAADEDEEDAADRITLEHPDANAAANERTELRDESTEPAHGAFVEESLQTDENADSAREEDWMESAQSREPAFWTQYLTFTEAEASAQEI